MRSTLFKVKIIIIATLVSIALLAYFGVYIPMKNELVKNIRYNFMLSTGAHNYAIVKFIDNSINDAKRFSTRSILNKKVLEFKQGLLSLNELRAHTSLGFFDELQGIHNLKGTVRVVEGNILSQYGEVDLSKIKDDRIISELTTEVDRKGHNSLLIVYSPILIKDIAVGFDIFYFDLSSVLNSIHEDNMNHLMYTSDEVQKLKSYKDHIVLDNLHLITDGKNNWYIQDIKQINMYFVTSISSDVLYGTIRKISDVILFSFITVVSIIVLLMNHFSVRWFKDLIEKLEKSKDVYKKYATTDSLTGAFSRMYFNQHVEQSFIKNSELELTSAVVMIDINKFKHINDKYGHLTGDAVLKKVADILKSSVRMGDIVVRYGGDEFLILLENGDMETSKIIIRRILEQIEGISEFGFPVKISYGVALFTDKSELLNAINNADMEMYELKRNMNGMKMSI